MFDGGTVVVDVSHCSDGEEAFVWTERDGMVGLGDLRIPRPTSRSGYQMVAAPVVGRVGGERCS